ncbi:MAG: PilZ domain-containing protein [Polyangiaceae bacterium]|nr:PilZ domain-containing protein [Polyangiaceae bacterium]MCW5792541.1 PilZ domain-containing protein [Polyangiaceae bacterium]
MRAEDSDWQREGVITDLGAGGACVELPDPLTKGTLVTLSVDAPNLWDPLRFEGRVAWAALIDPRGHTRVGIEFLHGSSKGLLPLADLLATDPYG